MFLKYFFPIWRVLFDFVISFVVQMLYSSVQFVFYLLMLSAFSLLSKEIFVKASYAEFSPCQLVRVLQFVARTHTHTFFPLELIVWSDVKVQFYSLLCTSFLTLFMKRFLYSYYILISFPKLTGSTCLDLFRAILFHWSLCLY